MMISKQDYISWYTPAPGFVLIDKDTSAEKMGRVYIPRGSREAGTKFAGTGIIVKLSPWVADREPYDGKLRQLYEVGQRVTFSNTTPFDFQLPAFCAFEQKEEGIMVLLHMADILGVIDIPKERFENGGN